MSSGDQICDIEGRLNEQEQRLSEVETQVDGIQTKMRQLNLKVDELQTQVQTEFEKIATQIQLLVDRQGPRRAVSPSSNASISDFQSSYMHQDTVESPRVQTLFATQMPISEVIETICGDVTDLAEDVTDWVEVDDKDIKDVLSAPESAIGLTTSGGIKEAVEPPSMKDKIKSFVSSYLHGIDTLAVVDNLFVIDNKSYFLVNHPFKILLAFKGGTCSTVSRACNRYTRVVLHHFEYCSVISRVIKKPSTEKNFIYEVMSVEYDYSGRDDDLKLLRCFPFGSVPETLHPYFHWELDQVLSTDQQVMAYVFLYCLELVDACAYLVEGLPFSVSNDQGCHSVEVFHRDGQVIGSLGYHRYIDQKYITYVLVNSMCGHFLVESGLLNIGFCSALTVCYASKGYILDHAVCLTNKLFTRDYAGLYIVKACCLLIRALQDFLSLSRWTSLSFNYSCDPYVVPLGAERSSLFSSEGPGHSSSMTFMDYGLLIIQGKYVMSEIYDHIIFLEKGLTRADGFHHTCSPYPVQFSYGVQQDTLVSIIISHVVHHFIHGSVLSLGLQQFLSSTFVCVLWTFKFPDAKRRILLISTKRRFICCDNSWPHTYGEAFLITLEYDLGRYTVASQHVILVKERKNVGQGILDIKNAMKVGTWLGWSTTWWCSTLVPELHFCTGTVGKALYTKCKYFFMVSNFLFLIILAWTDIIVARVSIQEDISEFSGLLFGLAIFLLNVLRWWMSPFKFQQLKIKSFTIRLMPTLLSDLFCSMWPPTSSKLRGLHPKPSDIILGLHCYCTEWFRREITGTQIWNDQDLLIQKNDQVKLFNADRLHISILHYALPDSVFGMMSPVCVSYSHVYRFLSAWRTKGSLLMLYCSDWNPDNKDYLHLDPYSVLAASVHGGYIWSCHVGAMSLVTGISQEFDETIGVCSVCLRITFLPHCAESVNGQLNNDGEAPLSLILEESLTTSQISLTEFNNFEMLNSQVGSIVLQTDYSESSVRRSNSRYFTIKGRAQGLILLSRLLLYQWDHCSLNDTVYLHCWVEDADFEATSTVPWEPGPLLSVLPYYKATLFSVSTSLYSVCAGLQSMSSALGGYSRFSPFSVMCDICAESFARYIVCFDPGICVAPMLLAVDGTLMFQLWLIAWSHNRMGDARDKVFRLLPSHITGNCFTQGLLQAVSQKIIYTGDSSVINKKQTFTLRTDVQELRLLETGYLWYIVVIRVVMGLSCVVQLQWQFEDEFTDNYWQCSLYFHPSFKQDTATVDRLGTCICVPSSITNEAIYFKVCYRNIFVALVVWRIAWDSSLSINDGHAAPLMTNMQHHSRQALPVQSRQCHLLQVLTLCQASFDLTLVSSVEYPSKSLTLTSFFGHLRYIYSYWVDVESSCIVVWRIAWIVFSCSSPLKLHPTAKSEAIWMEKLACICALSTSQILLSPDP